METFMQTAHTLKVIYALLAIILVITLAFEFRLLALPQQQVSVAALATRVILELSHLEMTSG